MKKQLNFKWLIVFAFLMSTTIIKSQNYSLKSCHAHNDYLNKNPFYEAYNLGFGSIEVDIFLAENELFVSHDEDKIDKTKTLKKLYIHPLLGEIEKNNGKTKQPLQLLIDLKTGGNSLKILENELVPFKKILNAAKVTIVISGVMPPPYEFQNYDSMLYFDGRDSIDYSKSELKRVALISKSFADFAKWNGKGQLGDDQIDVLEKFVKKIHKKGKKLRFWATPDTPTAWTTLMNLKLDFVGTDNLKGLAQFLE